MPEYVELEDHFEDLQACGKIDEDQAHTLARLLDAFADAPEHRAYFEDGPDDP